ncbi:hypothetical protein E8E14_010326 [Neopestalotiopsis sp. 37M]|nr:hypothetical protein E8E14_010326 [Neopestalotiopsis sp. 37M]
MTIESNSTFNFELLELMIDQWIPLSKTQSVDVCEIIPAMLSYKTLDLEQIQRKAFLALNDLSLLGLNHLPDIPELLHSPEDPSLPKKALVVYSCCLTRHHELSPRAWTVNGFMLTLTRYPYSMLNSSSHATESKLLGSLEGEIFMDYFFPVRIWFGAPFVHHEKAAAQAVAFTEQTRKLVEDIHP